MTPYIPIPVPLTPAWLTEVLHASGALAQGSALTLTSRPTSAFNSATSHLQVDYSTNVAPAIPTRLILKQNNPEPWAIEAGAEEVKFYQIALALDPPPPAIVPCYAAAMDAISGNSYLILSDLSETHTHPVTRDQQLSIVYGVPSAPSIKLVTQALAQHHAYWWNHPLLATQTFHIGYWSRNAERFALYLQRRQCAWDNLVKNEASWFPGDLLNLYEKVLEHLELHWQRYLEPRFHAQSNLTLVHGDAYFANFLCPRDPTVRATYLLDWQSPVVDIGGYDLANLCATFWTSAQRQDGQREKKILQYYLSVLQAHGITDYTWENLVTDYQTGLIYWLLVPLQDRYDGSHKDYWWPKMQCLVAAFRDWYCDELLHI